MRFHIWYILFCMFFVFFLYGFKGNSQTSPSVSTNALFLSRNSNFHSTDTNITTPDQTPNGLGIQEIELQFISEVDPYTRLNVLLSVTPKYKTDGVNVSQEWGLDPEEAFAESNALSDFTLKLGKFKAALGKFNLLHTHAFPFIEPPLGNRLIVGEEGLNDSGISASYLIHSFWFNELTMQYLRGKGENEEFNSPSPGGGVGLAHWKNLFDYSEETTIEIGFSFAQGGNRFRQNTKLEGADLTFKWRPTDGGKYRSLIWATEYLARNQGQNNLPDENCRGITSWLQYQITERWFALMRYDNLIVSDSFDILSLPNETGERYSIAVNFSLSEFSSYKFELNQRRGSTSNSTGEMTERSIFLQANYTIGAHPAHSY